MVEFSTTRQKLLCGRFGLWTTFLVGLGILVMLCFKTWSKGIWKIAIISYLFAGLKIPKGVSVNLEDGTKVDVKVGATLPDAVADVKPIMQIIRNRTDSISFNSKTNFIIAFLVRKTITVNGKIQHKISLKGTSMLEGDEEEVKRVGKDTLGDDYSSEEARKEAEEEEFDVMIFQDQADDDGDEFDWIVADVAA